MARRKNTAGRALVRPEVPGLEPGRLYRRVAPFDGDSILPGHQPEGGFPVCRYLHGAAEGDPNEGEGGWFLEEETGEGGGAKRFYLAAHVEEVTGAVYLRTVAVARLMLDNFDNLQASWVTQGPKMGAASLAFGVNDMGSTMLEENVVSAAGTVHDMDEKAIVAAIRDAGFTARRRDMTYTHLRPPVHA